MNVIARNYRPSNAERKAGRFQGDPSIVFDTFVCISRSAPLFIGWPDAELPASDRTVLSKLLGNMSSLGRAEGWVHAELLDGAADLPLGPAEASEPNPVPVFCPDPATAFESQHYPTFDPKRLAQGKVKPSDFLFDCPRWHLCLDTETIHSKRWPTVPGAKWVNYTRPPEVSAAPVKPRTIAQPVRTVARFALDAPVLPLVEETLPVAERVRVCLMGIFKKLKLRELYGSQIPADAEPVASEVFAGKDQHGQPLKGHQHAFFLPTDDDQDGRLDHVTVFAPRGFDRLEIGALNQLRELRFRDASTPPLRIQLVGLGEPRDYRTPLLAPSRVWISATPFLATRRPKRRGQKRDPPQLLGRDNERVFAEQVLREQIKVRQLPDPCSIVALPGHRVGVRQLRPIQFNRFRQKPSDDGGNRPAGAFKIVFRNPVTGPICLGHSCHFGLGLFLPGDEEEAVTH
jgi:CRISPR-associated protein Csb2